MATFTQDDVDYLRSHGNDECAKTWLGLWDPKRAVHQDHRELMIDKYERKRYYLEPASPLKSLTNAVALKGGSTATAATAGAAGVSTTATTNGASTSAAAKSAAAAAATNSNAYNKGNNGDEHPDLVHLSNGFSGGNNNNNKHHFRQQNTNAERSFQLTPPSTQRTTMNGLHKAANGTAVSAKAATTAAISRPQHQHQQQQQQQQQNGYSQSLKDAFMQNGCNNNTNINNNNNNNNNELNVLHMTTSRMSESSSATSVNGFGADTDFVADFGSAIIFDATTTTRNKMSSPPLLNGGIGVGAGGGTAISSNGYARIQPLKMQQQQKQQQQHQYQLLNGHSQIVMNGNSSQSESNGNSTSENFADFEHAPIFNAAVNYHFIRKNVIRRCAGGQHTDNENRSYAAPKQSPARERAGSDSQRSPGARRAHSPRPRSPNGNRNNSKTRNKSEPSSKSDTADELDKDLYADIRQATTHSEQSATDNKQPNSPKKPQPLNTPGTEAANKATTQKAVDELTCQLNAPQVFTFAPSVTQAEYSGYCQQARCTELTILNNQSQNLDPNQDQGGFCGGNAPQIDWDRYANNTPCWPPGSSACIQEANTEAAAAAASKSQDPNDPQLGQQQQMPPTFCPEVKFCPPTNCPIPFLPPPVSPRVCPLPPSCAAPNDDQQQQTDETVAGLSYGPIPQQTVINTAQSRPQNGNESQTEACLEPTPSYSTLYNRSYCQPPAFAYPNQFLQQTMVQPAQSPIMAPMPVPPECYNPFHPYCISGCCPKGCMPSNSIPVGDPIIDPSCNIHSAYSNCFCNNWCLPIPNNNNQIMSNHQNNSQNNNNKNAISSTPSEDRYAALKDLDEQLRESKAAATDVAPSYGMDTFANNGISSGVNPFNHQQVNPFQATTNGTSSSTAHNYFGHMTVITNGNGIPSQQQQQQTTHFYNYSNGYNGNTTTTAGTVTSIFPHTAMAAGPSGCGFGLSALQPTAIAATGAGGGGAFNNPFSATSTMNTNNPFL